MGPVDEDDLLIYGTVFIDGSAKMANGALNIYKGWGTIYLSGTFYMSSAQDVRVDDERRHLQQRVLEPLRVLRVATNGVGRTRAGSCPPATARSSQARSFQGWLCTTNNIESTRQRPHGPAIANPDPRLERHQVEQLRQHRSVRRAGATPRRTARRRTPPTSRADLNGTRRRRSLVLPALAVGSFLNVVVARVPLQRSVVRPASACMSCGTSSPGTTTSLSCPGFSSAAAAATAAPVSRGAIPPSSSGRPCFVAGCFWKFGVSWDAGIASVFCAVLVVLAAIDVDRRIVPNKIVLPAAVLVLAAQTVVHPSGRVAPRRPRRLALPLRGRPRLPAGDGDGRRQAGAAPRLHARPDRARGAVRGMLSALVPSVILFARHGAAARKMAIPFVPFLALGACLRCSGGIRCSTGTPASCTSGRACPS